MPRGPMKVVDNMITRKDNNKYQTTNIIYDQNSISIIDKIITKSNSHQIKPTQNNLTYTPLEKIWVLSSMRLVNRWTKKEQRGAKFENKFLILKIISLKFLKCSFISTQEPIETCHYPIFNFAKFHSQWDLRLLL